jgi:uncharacterized protein (DUF302 family)
VEFPFDSGNGKQTAGKELTVNPNNLSDTGLVTLPSAHSASETVERLKSLLAQKGIQVFARIDHAAEAKKVGLSLRPTQVLTLSPF